MVWPYFLSYIIVRGQRARNFLSTYIMYPMSGYTTSMSFKNAVLQYTYLTSICHIQNGVPELKMTNLMEWCGRNNGDHTKLIVGISTHQHRGGSHVVARALRSRRVSSNQRNPPNCRNLGPKWAKRNGHSKMAVCAKFLGYTSSMHPLAIASPTTTIVEPLVACIIVFYDLIQKSAPRVKDL